MEESDSFEMDDEEENKTDAAAHASTIKDIAAKEAEGQFTSGQRVEANYGGKGEWYPGVIANCRPDGTYGIDYDDGDKERGVHPKLIRAAGEEEQEQEQEQEEQEQEQ